MTKTTKYFKDSDGGIYTLPNNERLALRWYRDGDKWIAGALGYAWDNDELRDAKAVEITEQDALKHMGLTAFPGTESFTPKSATELARRWNAFSSLRTLLIEHATYCDHGIIYCSCCHQMVFSHSPTCPIGIAISETKGVENES